MKRETEIKQKNVTQYTKLIISMLYYKIKSYFCREFKNLKFMNNEYVNSMARRLEQDYGWNSNCAQPFAAFLCETNGNDTNCTPTLYSLWCSFIIAAHKLPRSKRPDEEELIVVLEQVAGWEHDGIPIRHLKAEYKKGLLLLDYYKYQVY